MKKDKINGAQNLVSILVESGVKFCFTNPGTSEMHFVTALDRVPGMRAVLGLFEDVVTGAADILKKQSKTAKRKTCVSL